MTCYRGNESFVFVRRGDEIALTELSANLPTLNERPFVTFTEDQDYGLEETIPPVRSALKH